MAHDPYTHKTASTAAGRFKWYTVETNGRVDVRTDATNCFTFPANKGGKKVDNMHTEDCCNVVYDIDCQNFSYLTLNG